MYDGYHDDDRLTGLTLLVVFAIIPLTNILQILASQLARVEPRLPTQINSNPSVHSFIHSFIAKRI